jgi:transcriptional regulator with XRE-family HTH domain
MIRATNAELAHGGLRRPVICIEPAPGEMTITPVVDGHRGEDMEELVSVSPPPGWFGALLRACRHRACLSQQQLAAQAELSERTVRNLEAGRVRSPRTDTVRLLADALQLSEPDRDCWFAVAKGVTHQRAPAAGGPPDDAPAPPPLTARHGGARNDGGLTSADQRELARLRRECHRLRTEVETLKRATAIFATATPPGPVQAGLQISGWRRTWPVLRSASASAASASGRRAETIDSRSRSPFMTRSTMSGMSSWGVIEP